MERSGGILIAAPMALLLTTPAAAQRRTAVPNEGMGAVGVSVGAALPFESTLKKGFDLAGQAEGYLSRRVSIRGQVSAAWLDITARPFTGTVKPIAFNGNVVYNWEGGAWHPYVTAGLGLYHYTFTENSVTSSDNKFGVDVGGGIEYFFTRHDTLLGEVLVHAIPGTVSSAGANYDAGYWTVSGGYKKYFGK